MLAYLFLFSFVHLQLNAFSWDKDGVYVNEREGEREGLNFQSTQILHARSKWHELHIFGPVSFLLQAAFINKKKADVSSAFF